jgi:hypothetical protein
MRPSDERLEIMLWAERHARPLGGDPELVSVFRELQLARRVVEQARREYLQSDELRGRIAAYDKADHA